MKWKYALADGAFHFSISTNFKAAGLQEYLFWLGEFRLLLAWQRGRGKHKQMFDVSLFQYANETEIATYRELQRQALQKFFDERSEVPNGPLGMYLTDLSYGPKPNIAEWCHYWDAADATSWGIWYATILSYWPARFLAAPETLDDWAWRVLWPHLKRNQE